MIKTGTLIASALIAVASFSAPSFAQSRSQYDIQLQRLNDIRQQTTDAGLNTYNRPLDHAPVSARYDSNRGYFGVYRQRAN